MRQGLEKILGWCSLIVAFKNTTIPDVSISNIILTADTINNDLEAIQKEFIAAVFDTSASSEVELLVQTYQKVLIQLLDDINSCVNTNPTRDLQNAYNSIANALTNLLFFIERYFARYFNLDEKVPDAYHRISRQEFYTRAQIIKAELDKHGVDPLLVKILFSIFEDGNANGWQERITYRKLTYLKELLNDLDDITRRWEQEHSSGAIKNLLIYLNFNDAAFVSYVVNNVSAKLDAEISLSDRVLFLKFQMKETNQINCRSWIGLHLDLPTAKEQIVGWIEEEINYLLNKSSIINSSKLTEQSSVELKLSTSLSVPQLACFVRLLVESKIITNTNQTDVLKFFSTHFTTLKKDNISYNHLRSQYYKPILSAIEAVKGQLLGLINLTRKLN